MILQSDRQRVINDNHETKSKVSTYRRFKTKKHPFSKGIREKLKPLYKLDNYHGVLALLENYLVIGITIWCTLVFWSLMGYWAIIFYPLTAFIIGTRQRAFATLLHEGSHYSLAKNKTLNFVLSTYLSSYFVFQVFYSYRKSHCQEHHRHLGNIEKDPDLQYYASQGLLKIGNQKEFIKNYLLPNWLMLKLPQNLWYLLKNRLLISDFSSQPKYVKYEYFRFIFYWLVLIILMIYSGTWVYFLIFWVIPFVSTFQALNCTIEVCEHYPIIVHSNKEIYMTRNRNGNWLERVTLGIHNEDLHLIHHMFTGIPFWNLRKAHKVLLHDDEYLFIDERSGGIITKSKIGNKSIIEGMFKPLFNQK